MKVFLYYGHRGSILFTLAALALTVLLAITSWVLIERPSMRHKRSLSYALPAGRPAG
jgi:peptidoglycan/LPS O-acetylase OafA/YrhL